MWSEIRLKDKNCKQPLSGETPREAELIFAQRDSDFMRRNPQEPIHSSDLI